MRTLDVETVYDASAHHSQSYYCNDFPLLLQRIRRSFRRHARNLVIDITLILFKLSEI